MKDPSDQVLRRASEMFHEIVSAFSSQDLIAGCRKAAVAETLREIDSGSNNVRSGASRLTKDSLK